MTKRIEWIDNAKGVAILLVVLGHVLIGLHDANIYTGLTEKLLLISVQIIYVFHMPFFFALSGYFFKPQASLKSYGHFIMKRFINLGIPYVGFSLILWLLKFIGQNDVRIIVPFNSLLNIWQMPIGPLWFLYVLFAIDLFISFFSIKIKNINILFGISLVASIVANIYPSDIYIVQRILVWGPIFLLGAVLKKYPIYQTKTILIVSSAGFIGFISNWIVHNPTNRISYNAPGWDMGILLLSVVLGFSIFSRFTHNTPGFDYFALAGRYSLPIYLIHVPIVSLVRIILCHYGIDNIVMQISLGLLIGWFGTLFIFNIFHHYPCLDFWIYPGKHLHKKEN